MVSKRWFVLIVHLLCHLTVSVDAAPEGPKSRPDVIVFSGDYPGWPWVCRSGNGTLFCVFREGTEHMYSEKGRALFTKSVDGGKTWAVASVIADEPQVDDRNVAIAEHPSGDLWVNYNTYTREGISQAMWVQSGDGGQTWSEPQPIPVSDTRTRSALKFLSNGWILAPLYLDPGRAAVAAISKDDGKTWEGIRIPNTEGFVGDEWDVIELEPGHLIGLSRNNHEASDRFFYRFESHDSGLTWEVPVRTNLQTGGYAAPVQLFMQDGVPTVIYPDQRMVSVSAAFTRDPEFLVWNLEEGLPCYVYDPNRTPILDGSYAVSAWVDPHTRLIVDYEIREDSKWITGYFVEFPENWGRE